MCVCGGVVYVCVWGGGICVCVGGGICVCVWYVCVHVCGAIQVLAHALRELTLCAPPHTHTHKVTELENGLGTMQQENHSLRDKMAEMKEAMGQAQGAVRQAQGERRDRADLEAQLREEVAALRAREEEWSGKEEARRKGEEELRAKVERLSEVSGWSCVQWGRGLAGEGSD